MALPPALATDLRNILRRFRAANGLVAVPGASGKALEAWLMMRLAQAARNSGSWTVTLQRGDGTPLPPGSVFALPSSQSGILPASAAVPGYVLLERIAAPPIKLELHCSLQWKGRSGATHECDVSLLPEDVAQPLRVSGGHPRGLPIAAFECKDKKSGGTTDEMRQTLARMFDLALVTRPYPAWSCRIFQAATSVPWGRRRSTYREFFSSGAFGIVRVGRFQRGARRLGNHYHVRRFGKVYENPATILAAEHAFMSALTSVDLI